MSFWKGGKPSKGIGSQDKIYYRDYQIREVSPYQVIKGFGGKGGSLHAGRQECIFPEGIIIDKHEEGKGKGRLFTESRKEEEKH